MYDKLLCPGENALEEAMLLQKIGQQTSVLHPYQLILSWFLD